LENESENGETCYGSVRKMQSLTTLCRFQCGVAFYRVLLLLFVACQVCAKKLSLTWSEGFLRCSVCCTKGATFDSPHIRVNVPISVQQKMQPETADFAAVAAIPAKFANHTRLFGFWPICSIF